MSYITNVDPGCSLIEYGGSLVPLSDKPAELTEEELRAQQAALAHEKYGALFEQNQDFIGWISIDGTNINYPVMQTPTNPDYYLKHTFDKSWSDYGVPYIEESCIAVFRFNTNKETFKYNECVTLNEEEFNEFMAEVHAREMYDTGVDAE